MTKPITFTRIEIATACKSVGLSGRQTRHVLERLPKGRGKPARPPGARLDFEERLGNLCEGDQPR